MHVFQMNVCTHNFLMKKGGTAEATHWTHPEKKMYTSERQTDSSLIMLHSSVKHTIEFFPSSRHARHNTK